MNSSSNTAPASQPLGGLKTLIWIYFWLLILEGALRKWVFPEWANPLLVARDPIVLLIYLSAMGRRLFPSNGFVMATIVLSIAATIASYLGGHGNTLVVLYGLHSNFLHVPLIFVIAAAFDRTDVEKIGRWTLLISIPMALLVLTQFRSSPNAWVNFGVGGSEGAQMSVGFDKIRPPGTFSFTNGLATFVSLSVAFLIYWQMKRSQTESKLAFGALIATVLMTAVSGSRSVLTELVLVSAAAVYICATHRSFFGRGVKTIFVLAAVCFVLQFWSVFRMGILIHQNRVDSSGGVKDGLVMRMISGFAEPFSAASETPVLGEGLGMGTTAAGGLLYGERTFLLAEGEWLRVIRESGPILGFAYILLRIAIALALLKTALRALKEENPLPLLIFSAAFPTLINGQFGVPTILGFGVLGAGLCLAAARQPDTDDEEKPFEISPESVTNPTRRVRGRSIYAENLHGR